MLWFSFCSKFWVYILCYMISSQTSPCTFENEKASCLLMSAYQRQRHRPIRSPHSRKIKRLFGAVTGDCVTFQKNKISCHIKTSSALLQACFPSWWCVRIHSHRTILPGTYVLPSLVWLWHSPCTWPAAGPLRTFPPDWADHGLVGQSEWSAAGSRTGRERAPSWPRPHLDILSAQHRRAGSWVMGSSVLCLHYSRTGLQSNNNRFKFTSCDGHRS